MKKLKQLASSQNLGLFVQKNVTQYTDSFGKFVVSCQKGTQGRPVTAGLPFQLLARNTEIMATNLITKIQRLPANTVILFYPKFVFMSKIYVNSAFSNVLGLND